MSSIEDPSPIILDAATESLLERLTAGLGESLDPAEALRLLVESVLAAELELKRVAVAQRRRADALAAAGVSLSASLCSREVVGVLLDLVVPDFADWAFIHVDASASASLRPPGLPGALHTVASRHRDAELGAQFSAYLAQYPAVPEHTGPGIAWQTNTPRLDQVITDEKLESAGLDDTRLMLAKSMGLTSAISVPLTARSHTFGALSLVRHGGTPFTDADLGFAAELGRRGALAMENARLYEAERSSALELQRALMPTRLPDLAELDVSARYLSGAPGTEVGGDWYDVVQLEDGRVVAVVGDVMGRGLPAAAVMAQLRAVLRSHALEGLAPAQMLARLTRFTGLLEGEQLATCLVAMHDPRSQTVTLASAGHLPPILIDPQGRANYVDVDPGLPLGVAVEIMLSGAQPSAGSPDRETVLPMRRGAILLLFTDGLVENRRVSLGHGLEVLLAGVQGAPLASATDACRRCLRVMGRDVAHEDDTAVLAVRRS